MNAKKVKPKSWKVWAVLAGPDDPSFRGVFPTRDEALSKRYLKDWRVYPATLTLQPKRKKA